MGMAGGKVRQWAGWIRLICKVSGGRVGKMGHARLVFRKKLQPLPWRIERGERWNPEQGRESQQGQSGEHCIPVPSSGSTQKGMLSLAGQEGDWGQSGAVPTEPQACP